MDEVLITGRQLATQQKLQVINNVGMAFHGRTP
jgi:hypothetical protein